MKSLVFALNIFFLLLGSACQVKEAASSGGLISGHAPTTNTFTLISPAAHTYVTGETVTLQITFPFPVNVTGTPQLALTVGATARAANYASGTGTTTLSFTYLFVAADNDADGIVMNSLSLNGGTLTFDNHGVSTDCTAASLTSKTLSQVTVDNTGPTITGFIQTNIPGFYHLGQTLNFAMTFSEAVHVVGTPRIAIALDTGGTVYANYTSGSGTTVLAFSYTITNSVADINGLNSITSPLDLNSGTIKDASGNASALTFAALSAVALPLSALVPFNGTLPYIVSVTPPANAVYSASQNLDVTVTFDRAVTVTSTPYIELTVGPPDIIRQAAYFSGTGTNVLKFRYTTVPGDDSPSGIKLATTITKSSGDIVGTAAPANSFFLHPLNDVYATPLTSGVIVNAPLPKAISVIRNVDSTIPIFGSTTADNVWIIDQELLFTVGFNTGVFVTQTSGTPRIPITVGGTTRYATYLSGGDGQTSLLFRYVIQEGDLDTDTNIAVASIDLNGGVITDSHNTNILVGLPVTQVTATTIDGVRPVISSVTPPANGSYSTVTGNDNTNMIFTLNWSEAVNYSTGSVYIPMNVGGASNNLVYSGNNNTAAVSHIPGSLAGQLDTDGVTLSSPIGGTAIIKDRPGNEANVFTFTPPATPSVKVDGVLPLVTGFTPATNGTYIIGQNIDFVLNFNESVTVNKIVGYPRVPVVIGATTRYLEPVSNGTGTSHTFRYPVVVSDSDTDGVVMGNPIEHSGAGYVRDVGLNLANTVFTPPSTPLVKVDGIRPTVFSVAAITQKTYATGQTIDFVFTYSENVNVVGTPKLDLTVGITARSANYFSGTGSTTITFRYTVPTGDLDTDGITANTTINLNGGTIKDIPGNDQTNLGFTAPTLTGVKVDGVGPSISSVTPPANSTYISAQTLSFTVNFSEAVTVTGTPTLNLNIGGATRAASYVSGSPSTALLFQYTVVVGESDNDGVATSFPLLLNGGTIKDAATNNADLTFGNATFAGILVDALAPTINSVTAPTAAAYQSGSLTNSTIQIVVNYSEAVTVTATPRIHLLIGGATRYANYSAGSGTAALTFSYSVLAADLDLDGIQVMNSSNIDLNGGTMKDASLNAAAVALGAITTSRVTVVYPSLAHWYDISDTASMTIASGSVTTMNDRIGTTNVSHPGAAYVATGFNGASSAYVTCTAATDFDTGSSITISGIIAAFKSPVVSSGTLIEVNNGAGQPVVEFTTLNNANIGLSGGQYATGAFGNSLTVVPNFWTSNSGNHYLKAVSWDAAQSKRFHLCKMDGRVSEIFLFSTAPTNAEMTQIQSYLSTKHGLSFP